MLERFKTLKQEIQEKPRSLFGKKASAEAHLERASLTREVLRKPFCSPDSDKPCVTVCAPQPGCECEAEAVRLALQEEINARMLSFEVGKLKVGCGGTCKTGPILGFPQKSFFYLGVTPEVVREVVDETLMKGRILFPLISIDPYRSFRPDIYYEKDSGLLAAIDDSLCMVEVAKYFLDFEEGVSCGKCVPCRQGMLRMQEIMARIVEGQGMDEDLEQIHMLCRTMTETPHCDFALTSSRPILSAITYFEDEFKAHIERKECPAGVCRGLVDLQQKANHSA